MKLKELNINDRPREKALFKGLESLSDVELVTILIGHGCYHTKMDALELAVALMKEFKDLSALYAASISELQRVKGIGKEKAIKLKAAIEIGRRFRTMPVHSKRVMFRTGLDVFEYYHPQFKAKRQEELMVILLNIKNEFISDKIIFKGCLDHCTIHQRDIFNYCIRENAAGFILVHNHPSGNPSPSLEDIRITAKIEKSAKIMSLTFLDHIIIGDNSFYSMKNNLKSNFTLPKNS